MFSESFLAMSICVAIFIPRPFSTAVTLRKRATAQIPLFPRNADNRSFPLNSKWSTDAADSGPGPPYSFSHDLSRCVTQENYSDPLASTLCLCICICICLPLPLPPDQSACPAYMHTALTFFMQRISCYATTMKACRGSGSGSGSSSGDGSEGTAVLLCDVLRS